MTQTMKASDVRANWANLLNKVYKGETEVVVEKSGIPVAAVVSAKEYENLELMKAQRAERLAVLDQLRDAFKDVPQAELEREVKKAIAQARAQIRAERTSSINRDDSGGA
jgi:prevent-host-death family protein